MKKIRNFLILLLCALPVLFLASCEGGLPAEAINRISTTQDKKIITTDFIVNASILYQGETFNVNWESDNAVAKIGSELVDNTGKADPNGAFYLVDIDYANNTEADQKVTLTATIKKGINKGTKNITFTVPKAVGVPKEELDLSKYTLTSIPEAIEIAKAAGQNATKERYYIHGTVKSLDSADYGAMTITDGVNELYIYGMFNHDGSIKYNQLGFKPVTGDEIIIYGDLCTYNGEPEVKTAWLMEFKQAPKVEIELPAAGTEISIATAIQIARQFQGDPSTDRWIVKGTIKTISNPNYGEMTITDGTDELLIYGTYSADGVKRYSELDEKPYAGDSVTLSVNLNEHKGTPQAKSGWILSFEHNEPEINLEDYVEKTLTEARMADDGAKVKVTGVVAAITYANGRIPNGVYLVDNGASIYVYGKDVAGRVQVGNTITLVAEKDYYILAEEIPYAEKYGYEGANQLSNAYVIEVDETVKEVNFSWVSESTVKEIMNIPFTAGNITTDIFKVNAYVNKVPGNGFINYYINDLDNKTGSYVYTQCSGGDFEWLDEFDGKICTVYLSAINCKSTPSGCVYRFVPIAVKDENFQFNLSEAAGFVYEYVIKDQFLEEYNANPSIKLITTATFEELGIQNATITYEVLSENANIEDKDGGKVLHITSKGYAKVKITVTVGESTVQQVIEIALIPPGEYIAISVSEANAKAVGTEVILEGIVAGSLVNKSGFYLIDETGVMAVVGAETDVSKLSIGDKVAIKGKRDLWSPVPESNKPGQICVTDFKVIVNYYGSHAYDKTNFISGKTVDDLAALKATEQHSNEVYITQAKVVYEETNYYTRFSLFSTTTDKYLSLYCSSAKQYNWLKQFDGKVVEMELVLCNWNKKDYYATCLLSVTYEGQTYYNTLNFAD